jgi:hypothetical protein
MLVEFHGLPLDARFVAKIRIAAAPHPRLGTPCWHWTGGTTDKGRGRFWWNGRLIYPYRYALSVRLGVDVSELGRSFGCHDCDDGSCCNPWHVVQGDAKSNARDMVARGRVGGFVRRRMLARQAAAIEASRLKRELRYYDERFRAHLAAD